MAGKHRKRPQIRSTVVKRGGRGLAAAALSATGLSTAVVTGTTAAFAPNVQLMALVSAASSTAQFFAPSTYYSTDWTDVYGEQQVVPFLLGPQGIADAIASHQDDEDETGVTAGGWGAGQAGTALGILATNDDPEDLDVGLVIFDNNTNRAGGGFWTTYYPFAPLLFTSADPTPTDLPGVTVLDVSYEYNINGNAAVDPLNLIALGNSLVAYVYDYGVQPSVLDITEEDGDVVLHQANGVDKTLEPGTHYVIKDGNIFAEYSADGTAENPNNSTVYVTVDSGDLPLTRPLRLLPGGDILADALDPTLTALVDAGYNDGKGTESDPAIPKDPTVTRPMQPGSSLSALGGAPKNTVQKGTNAGVQTASDDLSDPTNHVTKPLAEAGKLPLSSSLSNSALTTNNITATEAKKASPTADDTGAASSSERPRPLKKIVGDVRASLNKLAGGADENNSEESENNEE
jgi:hypothetical protein